MPVHAARLEGKALRPTETERPAINDTFIVLSQLHLVHRHCTYSRVYGVIIASIALLFLLPWHREVCDIAVET